jgi:hypothetical protein
MQLKIRAILFTNQMKQSGPKWLLCGTPDITKNILRNASKSEPSHRQGVQHSKLKGFKRRLTIHKIWSRIRQHLRINKFREISRITNFLRSRCRLTLKTHNRWVTNAFFLRMTFLKNFSGRFKCPSSLRLSS